MAKLDLKKQIEKKELELNALLEITQAINNNVAEDSLYKIFNFTLRSNLNINKLGLFALDDFWGCKVHFGTKKNFHQIKLDSRFEMIKRIHKLSEFDGECDFHEFEMVIPVAHKTKTLALIFIGGIDPEASDHDKEEMLKFIQALSNIIVVAIENKKLARQELQQECQKTSPKGFY